MANKACYLLKDYLSKNNLKTINYFRQTTKHYQIWLVILSRNINNKFTSLEMIKKKTTNISLKTIATIISDAEKLEYISRVKSKSDSRTKNIIPSLQAIKEFNTWVEKLQKNLHSLKK
jgi:hypothetical protein